MRPVRFVALSEDGHALVLADEVGRLLALPIDERISGALHAEPGTPPLVVAPTAADPTPSLSPRDIQARIRSGESAEDVARIAGVPVDRVLRYAGPVLQERAMLAQHARRTRLKGAEKPTPLAEVVNGRLSQHGIDTEKISWDAYRRDDGTWRIIATWPSGKATAQAVWDLDKTRQSVAPHDDMAQYLCAERPTPILGQEPAPERGGHALPGPSRGEPSRGGHGLPAASDHPRPGRDPIRAGRDALLASLDRPLGASSGRGLEPRTPAALAGSDAPRQRPVGGGAAALLGGGQGSAFDDDSDAPKEVPAVPSLAVLRPRRTGAAAAAGGGGESTDANGKPRKRLPSWDDVLFGSGPAARESS
ncbi:MULTISPECIES: septation protein SepH [unclassified Micromonospora]|uniref:septation protein SepH n=1 Tax=unclassified Micromonospora TaxID=2617518 RepID=UPI00249A5B44|nr:MULTISPECIES: septation protein SepH [unclassified Micromonospora]WFE50581.1 septation protein SepH [Micromonospora sp. WMMD1155]WFF02585.1 septation protein SepH [Micromonospora sp. WMMD964]